MMKAMHVSYTRTEPYLSVSSADEASELFDRIQQEFRDKRPVMAVLCPVGDDRSTVLEIGIRGEVGFARYASSEGAWWSTGTNQPGNEVVWYYFQDSDRDIPTFAEIPYETVKAAALDYMTRDGDRPAVIEWVDA